MDKNTLSRRQFLEKGAAGTAAFLTAVGNNAPLSAATAADPPRSDRPNVVVIMTDQHHFQALRCAGNSLIRTPNLDRLAREGILFTNGYVNAPICGPSRASFYTGHHCGKTRVFTNHRPIADGLQVLPRTLQQAGMQTARVGKLHLHPMTDDWGFEWHRVNDAMYNTYAPEADHSDYIRWAARAMNVSPRTLIRQFETDEESRDLFRFTMGSSVTDAYHHYNDWCADAAIRFLREERDGRPFFLHLGFFGPHQPMLPPEPWASCYQPQKVELLPQMHADVADIATLSPRFRKRAKRPSREGWTDHTWRTVLAAYYGQVTQIDHHIGRILAALDELEISGNTVVVFTADHGDHLGQYRLLQKGTMYEGSVHVPLLIRDPAGVKGRREERLVSLLDVYRTILARCGVEDPNGSPGRSMVPLLEGRSDGWQNEVFASLWRQSLLRRDHLKLYRRRVGRGVDDVRYDLFDLREEPYEMVSHAEDPAYSDVRAELQADLDDWHARQGIDRV